MLHREQSTFTYVFFHVLLDHNLVSKSGLRVGAHSTEKTEAQELGWDRDLGGASLTSSQGSALLGKDPPLTARNPGLLQPA